MTPSSLSKDRERGKARACNSKLPPPPSLAFPAHWLPFGSKRVHNPLHCRPHDYRSRPTSPHPSSPPLAVSCLYSFQEKEGRLSSVSQLTAEETEAGLGLSKLTLPRAPGLRHPPVSLSTQLRLLLLIKADMQCALELTEALEVRLRSSATHTQD